MKAFCAAAAIVGIVWASGAAAAPQTSGPSATAPTLVRLDGQLTTPGGAPRTGSVTLVVSLYAEKDDTTPLWVEPQVVALDATGRYTVLAGATLPDGVPPAFLTGATPGRWLGVGVQGEAEQFRLMLVTVPYALKAREADTLAGKSVGDFVLTESLTTTVQASLKAQPSGASSNGGTGPGAFGTINRLEKCSNTASPCTLADSLLFDNDTNVGVGNAAPAYKLDVLSQSAIAPPTFRLLNGAFGGGQFVVNVMGGSLGPLANGDALMTNGVGNLLFSPNAAGKSVGFVGGLWTNPLAMTVADGGNVGIGTSTPAAKLEIRAAGVAPSSFSIVNSGAGGGRFGVNPIGSSIASVVAGDALIQNGVGNLVFSPNAAGKDVRFIGGAWTNPISVVVKDGGNVGIGTTSPGYLLDVANRMRVRQSGLNTAGIWFYPTAPAADRAFVGMNTDTQVGFYGSTGAGWGMVMDTTSGNVGIGTTDLNPLFSEPKKLQVVGSNTVIQGVSTANFSTAVSGVANFGSSATAVSGISTSGIGGWFQSDTGYAGLFFGNVQVSFGDLTVSGNVCSANILCLSDARLKENVRGLDYGLPHLMRLRPARWSWIDPAQKQLPIGLIAQEVDGVIPELVLRDADSTKPLGLNYLGFVPVIIKAIQDQQDLIAALQAENATLKADNEILKQQHSALDARLATLERAGAR